MIEPNDLHTTIRTLEATIKVIMAERDDAVRIAVASARLLHEAATERESLRRQLKALRTSG